MQFPREHNSKSILLSIYTAAHLQVYLWRNLSTIMTVEKPKPKQLLGPITTGTNSVTNQSQFLAITCNSLEAREKSCVHGAIGFASHWLKNWNEFFKPITKA